MDKEQIMSVENGNINDSNNINEGNAGRDIVTHNYTSDIMVKKHIPTCLI